VTVNEQSEPLLPQVSVWPVSTSIAVPFVLLYTDPAVIVMLVGADDHVGAWFFTVIEIVEPTESDGEPLSEAATLKLQVWAGTGAVKLTLQLRGDAPEPLTVMLNPHDVPLFEQVSVWPVSTS